MRPQGSLVHTEPDLTKIVEGVLRLDRTLAVIDIENLVGGPLPGARACDRVRTFVRSVCGGAPVPVVAACSHVAAKSAAFSWPEARWKFKSGKDGADLALIEELDPNYVSNRFKHLILGSGDGIFVEHVAALVAAGVAVTLLSRPESLSRKLREAATTWIPFVQPRPVAASKNATVREVPLSRVDGPELSTFRNEIPLSA